MNLEYYIKNITFPETNVSHNENFRKITARLREHYYKNTEELENTYKEPYGEHITESIGGWPEFILKGFACKKSKKGYCSPCFYSKLPSFDKLKTQDVYDSLLDQTKYILDNFEEIVEKKQISPINYPDNYHNSKPISFVLTPTGSFFCEYEFPSRLRNEILNLLLEHSNNIQKPFTLHLETHAKDFISFQERDPATFRSTISILQKLNARILFGFESANNYVRNKLYNKNLKKDDFEKASNIVINNQLGAGAFVFIGLSPLNDVELIVDAVNTIDYLNLKSISPILMFSNIQPYTITEMLYLNGYENYKLPEPRTIIEIIKYLLENERDKNHGLIDSWFIADPIGGPPPPKYNLFSAKNKITCNKCSGLIYEAIRELRETKNKKSFFDTYDMVNKCDCTQKYKEMLDNSMNIENLSNRVKKMGNFIEKNIDSYLANKTIEERISLKAELLCKGINAKKANPYLSKFNSYIKEAGFVHAVHLKINDDFLVNVCIAEKFCANSPYSIDKIEGNFFRLLKDDEHVANCKLIEMPEWTNKKVDGIKIGDFLRPHSDNIISAMPMSQCHFYEKNLQCHFCSLQPFQKVKKYPAILVAKAVREAVSYNKDYELNLSGGTACSRDHSANYFIEIINKLNEFDCKIPISIEIAPPLEKKYLDELKNIGARSIIMNIEFANETYRKKYCPGKFKRIPIQDYFESIKYAVNLFGAGQVSSVIIAGLIEQDETISSEMEIKQILELCKKLINLKAIPTIIPFKPFNDCDLSDKKTANPETIIEISKQLCVMLKNANLFPKMQSGCTKCGGCSLETLTI